MPLSRSVCLVGLLVLASTGCDVNVGDKGVSVGLTRGKAEDQWARTYTLGSGGTLEIVNVNGAIGVAAAEGPDTQVTIDRQAGGPSDESAKAALEGVEIIEDARPGHVKVEVRRPGKESLGRQVRVSYRVRLAAGTTASLRTENGAIQLDGVTGRITASVRNGGISGRMSGSLSASAVNGGIQIAMDAVSGNVELTTVNGPIRLELLPDVKAEVVAGAVNGGVSVDDQLHLAAGDAAAGGGFGRASRVTGTINGGGPRITAQATNGGIRIAASGSSPPPGGR